jgi:hypothetical protein
MNNNTIDFAATGLKIPAFVYTMPPEKQQEIYDYLIQLDDHNRRAYTIAIDHLGTSFNIYRSNGFKEWLKSKANAL